jgi:hypothetical protein
MLSIIDLALSSPPNSAQLTAYRPAVSFKNTGDVPAYITGTLSILDKTSGRTVYSSQLYSPPVPPGATGTATSSTNWTPAPSASYEVRASLFAGNADISASSTLTPVTVTSPGAIAPTSPTRVTKITLPSGTTVLVHDVLDTDEEEEKPPVIQYPFYLNF